ncbi:DUF115 domain-containing protein [Bacillus sp. PK3-056]|uniref:motility associated factor glycosyltransferase family protein n=1 Tax=Niallia circulans TaxID=1397 RepID=UPI000F44C296|nr:6-hydroxymethylpterin diphosphokinase MptE-like protein [Niallia circulans]AYV73757.1 hypothetical protein C2H98_20540 [Niallia circulans]
MGENQTLLMNMFPYLRSSLNTLNNETDEEKLEILHTKVENTPTLSVMIENRNYYLHSKYDPRKEAEVLIERYKDEFEKYDHVLFYGVGLGYHVETLLKRYPNMNYSLFEPVPSVFYQFLESNRLDNLDLSRLKNVFIDTVDTDPKDFLINLTGNIQERIMLIALPSYERIFERKFQQFTEDFKEAVAAKYESHYIDNKYSARWTLNSLINLPTTLSTPNILNGFDHIFKDKPLIIVSAGPSLQEEYENLKKIKRDKTAYIFAVGSANKALIANGIIPDAVCTYDPQEVNHTVFTKMLEKNIINVPMIYGSSVGFETLKYYPGPKLNMLISQDTVSPYYFESKENMRVINDAPTIAAIALQLAAELGCNPVILVGQNLAFKGNKKYSTEIEEEKKINELAQKEKGEIIVEDVYGNKIKSTKGFINMKSFLEYYISMFSQLKVINTTKGGAKIIGAEYQPLEQLIEKELTKKVVKENWHNKQFEQLPAKNTIKKLKQMEQSLQHFDKLYGQLQDSLAEMEKITVKKKQENKLSVLINKINDKMFRLTTNDFYQVFIQPINRTQYQALLLNITKIKKVENNLIHKAQLIINSFSPYLNRCKMIANQIAGTFYQVHEQIRQEMEKSNMLFYPFDCGVFNFSNNWIIKDYSSHRDVKFPVRTITNEKNLATMKFRIRGEILRIYGVKRNGKVRIRIGEYVEDIQFKSSSKMREHPEKIYQLIYEKKISLKEIETVEITMCNDQIEITGIEIDGNGEIHHIDEVKSLEDLTVGKRIRMHYSAKYNKIGGFSKAKSFNQLFLPTFSSATPDGDFYFICVAQDENGKKLIADRNIQHSISWESIENEIKIYNNKCLNISWDIPTCGIYQGSSDNTESNDWQRYITSWSDKDWLVDLNFHVTQLSSWCKDMPQVNKEFYWIDGKTVEKTNKDSRMRAGRYKVNHKMIADKKATVNYIGFRPIWIID